MLWTTALGPLWARLGLWLSKLARLLSYALRCLVADSCRGWRGIGAHEPTHLATQSGPNSASICCGLTRLPDKARIGMLSCGGF